MARVSNPYDARHAGAALAAALAMIGGCATGPDAQWIDPQQSGKSFSGAKVLVVCDAYEPAIQRICQERLSSQVIARGAQPVLVPEAPTTSPWRPGTTQEHLEAARSAEAKAVLSAVVRPEVGGAARASGSSIGISIGGFGGGRSSGVGAGVGFSTPIGDGERSQSAYAADGVLTDVASGKMVWTAKVSSPPSSDIEDQVDQLTKRLVDAAQKAGLF